MIFQLGNVVQYLVLCAVMVAVYSSLVAIYGAGWGEMEKHGSTILPMFFKIQETQKVKNQWQQDDVGHPIPISPPASPATSVELQVLYPCLRQMELGRKHL